nr:MAG TPA: hypothetical protein [Caudoviricetes sp.]
MYLNLKPRALNKRFISLRVAPYLPESMSFRWSMIASFFILLNISSKSSLDILLQSKLIR